VKGFRAQASCVVGVTKPRRRHRRKLFLWPFHCFIKSSSFLHLSTSLMSYSERLFFLVSILFSNMLTSTCGLHANLALCALVYLDLLIPSYDRISDQTYGCSCRYIFYLHIFWNCKDELKWSNNYGRVSRIMITSFWSA